MEKYTIITESNHFRPYHAHNEKCLDLVGIADQAAYGYCRSVKHSDECVRLTDVDLFRKREKEIRQRVALQELGV